MLSAITGERLVGLGPSKSSISDIGTTTTCAKTKVSS